MRSDVPSVFDLYVGFLLWLCCTIVPLHCCSVSLLFCCTVSLLLCCAVSAVPLRYCLFSFCIVFTSAFINYKLIPFYELGSILYSTILVDAISFCHFDLP